MGGIHHQKGFLLSPCPAIPPYVVRTLHPGTTDDREHNTNHSGQREPWKPTERQGEARRAQESPGEPRGAPDSPGQPRRGEPRRTQGSPGNRRSAQESLGGPRRTQENPGEPRRAQESDRLFETIRGRGGATTIVYAPHRCCFKEQRVGCGSRQQTDREDVEFPVEKHVKLPRRVIGHYVFTRDLGVRSAPALHWLWFGTQEATALQGEGS